MDEVLAQSGLFQGLSEEAVSPVASRLETITLPRGRVVFNEGEPGESLYIVLSGKIKLSRRAPDGRENVLARRLRRTNDSVADLIFTDVPGRVAKALLQMADRFGSRDTDGLKVKHDLTQEELAQLVGASRETVNKALADFVHRGWIQLQGKSVVILDEDRLRRRAR